MEPYALAYFLFRSSNMSRAEVKLTDNEQAATNGGGFGESKHNHVTFVNGSRPTGPMGEGQTKVRQGYHSDAPACFSDAQRRDVAEDRIYMRNTGTHRPVATARYLGVTRFQHEGYATSMTRPVVDCCERGTIGGDPFSSRWMR